MNNSITLRQQLQLLFVTQREWTAHQLIKATGLSKQRVHQLLKELIENETLQKTGKPPKVVYTVLPLQVALKDLM